tara:strand:- start:1750 stop:1980 length:231 start_codon:yes stop_codon:yes gene_type:complete
MSKPLNAYHNVPDGANIYDKNNNYIGIMNGLRARCTATTPGSIQIMLNTGEEIWYSGQVCKMYENWNLVGFKLIGE